jgi:hypothetical protein
MKLTLYSEEKKSILCEFMVKRHPLLYFKEISNTHDALRKCKK